MGIFSNIRKIHGFNEYNFWISKYRSEQSGFDCMSILVCEDMCVCVLCVYTHLLWVCVSGSFFIPPVSPKQGKRIIITSSECISPSFSLEQNNPHHIPPPHPLPASSPRRCEERPGVKCKRENAVVQTVPTTSVSHSPPSRPLVLFAISLSLPFSGGPAAAGCRYAGPLSQ